MNTSKIRKNRVSHFISNKVMFTQSLEVDLNIIIKNGIFVDKIYTYSIFKLNINMNKAANLVYIFCEFNI